MNIRPYNSQKFRWFVVTGEGLDKVNRGGSVQFKTYTDHQNAHGLGHGTLIQYATSKDSAGRPVAKHFLIDESRRRWQVRETDQDINGITQFNFLKFSPECEGSPNGTYVEMDGIVIQQNVMFRELDGEKDAEVALEAEAKRTEAKASAFKLDDKTLQEVAAFANYFGKPGKEMRLIVVEFAEKRPNDYFKVLNAGDRGVRALIRKAIADGMFTTKGSVIYWQNTLIGADEDAAVSAILKDQQILDVLQQKVNLGTSIVSTTPPKNKGGRPKKVTQEAEQK